MAGRRSQSRDPEEGPKRLTLEDVEVGLRKMRRRIDEVKALDPQAMRYDDPRVEEATRTFTRTCSTRSDDARQSTGPMEPTRSVTPMAPGTVLPPTGSCKRSSFGVCPRPS